MTLKQTRLRDTFRPFAVRLVALALCAGQLSAAQATCSSYVLPGANVAGGEFNAGALPGRPNYDYVYPSQTEVDLLKSLKLKLMRVPFLWERVQPNPSGPLVEGEMARLDAVVALAAANGLTVVLDVHNYGRYRGTSLAEVGAPAWALPDLWRRLAGRYANRSNVVFGMMNEPNGIAADRWAAIARQTLDAIRAAGATNLVMIPGTNWDGAQSWFSRVGTQSNAEALLPIARSDDRVVFEVHQYFDTGFSGTAETCTSAVAALASVDTIGTWARTNHVKLFLGEFGVSQRAECVKALDDALALVERDKDVWYGYTYWAAGAWWGNYLFNLQSTTGRAIQGAKLKARATTLDNASCPASTPGPVTSPAPVPPPAPVPAPTPTPPPRVKGR